ncbi:DUF6226 family protein [Prescottella defluvii]|nr:DUF6226 family protein [Prescottella defluvii]
MATEPKSSWWDAYNDRILSARATGWAGNAPLLSPEMCALLDDVDAAFAVTGADTPQWPHPYKDGPEPDEAAYERVTDPEKFLIVVARARAWTKVLLDRGWARERRTWTGRCARSIQAEPTPSSSRRPTVQLPWC